MSLTPQKDGRICFVACNEEHVKSGACSCINSLEDYQLHKSIVEHIAKLSAGYKPKLIKTRKGSRVVWEKKK